jgi:hypothetical protein
MRGFASGKPSSLLQASTTLQCALMLCHPMKSCADVCKGKPRLLNSVVAEMAARARTFAKGAEAPCSLLNAAQHWQLGLVITAICMGWWLSCGVCRLDLVT